VESLGKAFGDVVALDGIELGLREGEFVAVLGPSGCGKTTLLRTVAGFERPTRGSIRLEGRDVTREPAHKRAVNTVFQRAILFPHLSVFENVAFGLRIGGLPRREIASRVHEALALVRLSGLEQRRAHEVSGGQAQRVSLARALVNRPRLLLLDEPLSSLDLKVRIEMQAELRRIHRETGTAFLYVTHDQQEAISLCDRLVVMNEGRIQQVAPPSEIYFQPASPFVAWFVGNANLLPAEAVDAASDTARRLITSDGRAFSVADSESSAMGWVVLRPEAVRIATSGSAGLPGEVTDVAFLGASTIYEVRLFGHELRVQEATDGRPRFAIGDAVSIDYDSTRSIYLPKRNQDEARAEVDEHESRIALSDRASS